MKTYHPPKREIAEVPTTPQAPLLPEQTNEELLVELRQMRQRRQRIRKVLGGVYVTYFTGYALFIVWLLLHISSKPASWLFYMPPLVSTLFPFMGACYGINRLFYQRQAKRGNQVIMALAQRGETRALGPLLEIMDTRMSGQGGWTKSRAVFMEAVIRLLAGLTPEAFQELSDTQIHQLTPLLLMPDPALHTAVQDAFMRAGDSRALHAIRRMLQVSRIQKMQKWNPTIKPMIHQMKKWNWPVYDEAGVERLNTCIATMAARVEADNRNAQLLRAADGSTADASELLLRGAGPSDSATPASELLRVASLPTVRLEAEAREPFLPLSQRRQTASPPAITTTLASETPQEQTLSQSGP